MYQHADWIRGHGVEFWLPEGWGGLETFYEDFSLGGFRMHLYGCTATHKVWGRTVLGSAAEFDTDPSRAYFELMERILTIDSLGGADSDTGSRVEPRSWRPAISNGYAIQSTMERASQAAHWELIERDRVLRSWFGLIRPREIPCLPALYKIDRLEEKYNFFCFEFPNFEDPQKEVHVAGVFGFPRDAELPVVYGFGAEESLPSAKGKAVGELLQKLGFVLSESWRESLNLEPRPDPSFHSDFFLSDRGREPLQSWLFGSKTLGLKKTPISLARNPKLQIRSSISSPSPLVLVQASQEGRLPLHFGMGGYDDLFGCKLGEQGVHPIA